MVASVDRKSQTSELNLLFSLTLATTWLVAPVALALSMIWFGAGWNELVFLATAYLVCNATILLVILEWDRQAAGRKSRRPLSGYRLRARNPKRAMKDVMH